jgi:presenilin-like A22 family membrane protease
MLAAVLMFVVAQIITISIAALEAPFFAAQNIYSPSQSPDAISVWPGPETLPSGQVIQPPAYSSLGPIVIYFLAVTGVVAVVLALIPQSALKVALRIVFAFLFAWGALIAFIFWLPLAAALAIAVSVAVVWFLKPRVWFHDLAMILAMASLGAIFGRFITPWTAMAVVGALAIYDVVAVRLGFMMWLAARMSRVGVLPALIIPKNRSQWSADLRQSAISNMVDQKPAERDYSILGGGDIGFPCLLTTSVYFAYDLTTAVVIAGFALLGLLLAYLIQTIFLKGKAMPALPPIAILALAGLLIIR